MEPNVTELTKWAGSNPPARAIDTRGSRRGQTRGNSGKWQRGNIIPRRYGSVAPFHPTRWRWSAPVSLSVLVDDTTPSHSLPRPHFLHRACPAFLTISTRSNCARVSRHVTSPLHHAPRDVVHPADHPSCSAELLLLGMEDVRHRDRPGVHRSPAGLPGPGVGILDTCHGLDLLCDGALPPIVFPPLEPVCSAQSTPTGHQSAGGHLRVSLARGSRRDT